MSTPTVKPMTRTEREELKRLARERARVAKADVDRRSADLKAVFEQQLIQHYEFDRDDVWKEAVNAAQEAVNDAAQVIADRCVELGIPRELAPTVSFEWVGRGPYAVKNEQGELRRAAYKRVEAMERTAKHEIDRRSLEIQTQLVAAGLTSERGIEFLASMPTPDELMPELDMSDLMQPRGLPRPDDDVIDF